MDNKNVHVTKVKTLTDPSPYSSDGADLLFRWLVTLGPWYCARSIANSTSRPLAASSLVHVIKLST